MVPAGPWRRRRKTGNVSRAGRGADQAGQQRRERPGTGTCRKLAASRYERLGGDREPAGLHGTDQRLGAGEAGAGQVLLDRSAAGDPRLGRASLDDHPPAVGELGGNDLRQVPRAEQHAGRTGPEMTVAPFSQEGIIPHGDQYPRQAGNPAPVRKRPSRLGHRQASGLSRLANPQVSSERSLPGSDETGPRPARPRSLSVARRGQSGDVAMGDPGADILLHTSGSPGWACGLGAQVQPPRKAGLLAK